jgi:hypothetical protein
MQLEGTVQATTKQLDVRVHELDALKVPNLHIVSVAHALVEVLKFGWLACKLKWPMHDVQDRLEKQQQALAAAQEAAAEARADANDARTAAATAEAAQKVRHSIVTLTLRLGRCHWLAVLQKHGEALRGSVCARMQASAETVPDGMAEEFRQLKRHAKWAAQAALDAEQRIKELESQLAAQVLAPHPVIKRNCTPIATSGWRQVWHQASASAGVMLLRAAHGCCWHVQARQHEEAGAAASARATAAAGAQSVMAGRVTELEEQLQAVRTAADVDADAARCPRN